MNKLTSVYLDLIRFSTAMIVLFHHARSPLFTDGWLLPLRTYGNDAVMVFFVLSGFVIAYCTDIKERNISDYAINRLSRLYSLVLPALIITIGLDIWGQTVNKSIYKPEWFNNPALSFFANLFFVNQIWFLNIAPFSNGPFWSLGYEFWYYVIFGAYKFTTGHKKIFITIIAALFIGPKILLLLPVWWAGVFAYNISKESNLEIAVGYVLFIGSIVLYAIFRATEVHLILNWKTAQLLGSKFMDFGESRNFLSSYIVGLLVAMNFIGFSSISKHFVWNRIPSTIGIQFLSSHTFTLYILHYPLLHFFAAITNHDPSNSVDQTILISLTLASILLLAQVTEHRKAGWKKFFAAAIK